MKKTYLLTATAVVGFSLLGNVVQAQCPALTLSMVNKILKEGKYEGGWTLLNPEKTSERYPLDSKVEFDVIDPGLKVQPPREQGNECTYDVQFDTDPHGISGKTYPVGRFTLEKKK